MKNKKKEKCDVSDGKNMNMYVCTFVCNAVPQFIVQQTVKNSRHGKSVKTKEELWV